ncbi:hypothetical protein [Oleisolibacter albus]|uniref:hypothetical protein n=1 Tax=Oleisolibacter albus TaxID=2171757 RepID=UPI000DF17510|nr:hypothetical protein [Oleisolibacter albus]
MEISKGTPKRAARLAAGILVLTLPWMVAPVPGQAGPAQPEPHHPNELIMVEARPADAPLPTSDQAAIEAAATAYVVKTKTLFLKSTATDPVPGGNGRLLSPARLAVLDRKGSQLQVRLEGWQIDGVPSVIYAARGTRLMLAVLDETAMAAVQRRGAASTGANGQIWSPVRLSVWIDATGLTTDLDALWRFSATLYQSRCGICHVLPEPTRYLAAQWADNLEAMRRYTALTDDQFQLLLGYLQHQAGDGGTAER